MIKVTQNTLAALSGNRDLLDQAGRDTTAVENEIVLLSSYLPQMMSDVDTIKAVGIAGCDVGADSMKDMGKVMALLKERHGAQINMKLAARVFKDAEFPVMKM